MPQHIARGMNAWREISECCELIMYPSWGFDSPGRQRDSDRLEFRTILGLLNGAKVDVSLRTRSHRSTL
ncbi:hypothetical protein, partial [Timonella senegalensis]|uniref:hypothetical protein n=1 Tax=Timonella senegalensis TaxID=1465825 RepID=UPI002FE2DA99